MADPFSSPPSSPPQVRILGGTMSDFHTHLKSSTRILALLGAGLSASSGLPTFRGAGGLWRTHDAMDLATPEAFDADPGLVWQFYSYRRHKALKARPNRAHYALAELARKMDRSADGSARDGKGGGEVGFCCLSQNVDGLSQRADHPRSSLQLLHGSLFDIKCTDFYCKHTEQDNFTDPIAPSLAIPTTASGQEIDPTTDAARGRQTNGISAADSSIPASAVQDSSAPSLSNSNGNAANFSTADAVYNHLHNSHEADISDINVPIPKLSPADLPHCPQCKTGLLRPGVVWFGEMLPERTIRHVDEWITSSSQIDLIMVIGTSARVYPAAGYVSRARAKGARVAVVNTEEGDVPQEGMMRGDWVFVGDAGVVVPEMLGPLVGEINGSGTERAGGLEGRL